MDLLSDVLHVVRLRGSVFFTARLTAPWCLNTPRREELGAALPMHPDHLMLFHILAEGSAWVRFGGQPAHPLTSGSVVIFPDAGEHIMSSEADAFPRPLISLLPEMRGSVIPHIDYGGGGETSEFVCGYFYCDQRLNPLFNSLPTALILHPNHGRSASSPDGQGIVELAPDDWLRQTIVRAIDEARRRQPGAGAMLARITEMIFVDTLRRYLQQLPDGAGGWLAAIRDPEIGRAMSLLHLEPARRWTVGDLAAEIGVSRSGLAHRFTTLVGESPMHYLTNWRMQLAQRYLIQSSMSVKQVAFKLGYESDVAFSRAFKRCTGDPPASWRRRAYA